MCMLMYLSVCVAHHEFVLWETDEVFPYFYDCYAYFISLQAV